MDVERGVWLIPHGLEISVDGVGRHGAESSLQEAGEVQQAVGVIR